MIKKYFSAVLIFLSALLPASGQAGQPESLTLKNVTVEQLRQIYKNTDMSIILPSKTPKFRRFILNISHLTIIGFKTLTNATNYLSAS